MRSSGPAVLVLLLMAACALPPASVYDSPDSAADALVKLARAKHDIHVVPKWTGNIFWVYVPLDDLMFVPAGKQIETRKRYDAKKVEGQYQKSVFDFKYDIRPIPETVVVQKIQFDTNVSGRVNTVSRLAQGVLFGLKKNPGNPTFLGIIATDINTGVEVIYISHLDDVGKTLHKLIPVVEYRHRMIQAMRYAPDAVGDTTGRHLKFTDFEFNMFLADQIENRLIRKFGGSEAPPKIDVDREAVRTASHVLGIYRYDDFKEVEFLNLASGRDFRISKETVENENSVGHFVRRSFRLGDGADGQ